jgi:hypothetical protein
MELLSIELALIDTDESSAHYGPAMGTLTADEAPTVLFVPLARIGTPHPTVTITLTVPDEPEPSDPE